MNATQIKIILCVYDYTELGTKHGAELSLSTLSSELDTTKRMITQELKKLIKRNIINVVEDYSCECRYGRVLKVNKPNEWRDDINVQALRTGEANKRTRQRLRSNDNRILRT